MSAASPTKSPTSPLPSTSSKGLIDGDETVNSEELAPRGSQSSSVAGPSNSRTASEEWSDDDDEESNDYDYYYSFSEEVIESQGLGSASGDGSGGGCGAYNNNEDPESFAFECFNCEDAHAFLREAVNTLVTAHPRLSSDEAQNLLQRHRWAFSDSSAAAQVELQQQQQQQLSIGASSPRYVQASDFNAASDTSTCDVCATVRNNFSQLKCGHRYCFACWEMHFECQLMQGIASSFACMSNNCDTLAPGDFVLRHLRKPEMREKFQSLSFQSCIHSHPLLRFCPGLNCEMIIKGVKPLPKKCICVSCKTTFCFLCGGNYHAPTDCETIKRWLTKCADDSETANYISAHTKDCPRCNICIEKNGGCNHMQCFNCKFDFCWMCLGDWKTHGSEYYECSRYKENPNIANESANAQAREALKKYLHYYERWENHSKSMKLEAHTLEKIKSRITEKVMSGSGTWIDWQYLLDASALLAKCRYTLQYTYPYAYYMEACPRKQLFEYQQAQLEAEIENLSWKIEHAETTDRGELENQIDIAEKRRTSLLKDFLAS